MATSSAKKRAAKPRTRTVDEYLAAAPRDQRSVLKDLRETIKAAAPKSTESVSYGIVGYKYRAQRLIYFGYWKDHLSLYGFSSRFVDAHADELRQYEMDKGTLRFTAAKPISRRLVTKMVKDRIAEIDARG
jgi:uncharacterized protein YdhG (YjbR/CyaY superfamily)